MPGELQAAVDLLDERKIAAFAIEEDEGMGTTDAGGARVMFSGFDLDFEEVRALRMAMVEASIEGLGQRVNSGAPPETALLEALASMFVEGLLVGLQVEKARRDA